MDLCKSLLDRSYISDKLSYALERRTPGALSGSTRALPIIRACRPRSPICALVGTVFADDTCVCLRATATSSGSRPHPLSLPPAIHDFILQWPTAADALTENIRARPAKGKM